jgi:hypothetical protein
MVIIIKENFAMRHQTNMILAISQREQLNMLGTNMKL